MYVRLVHLWGARAKHTVIMRIPSSFGQIIRTRLFSHDYGQPSSPSAYLFILRSLLTFIRLCLTIGSRVDDICGEQ